MDVDRWVRSFTLWNSVVPGQRLFRVSEVFSGLHEALVLEKKEKKSHLPNPKAAGAGMGADWTGVEV